MRLSPHINHVRILNHPLAQARGLRFSHLRPDEAVLFPLQRPTRLGSIVDMLFVFTDLGILWLDHKKKIIDKRHAWPFLFYLPRKKAAYVLEIHPTLLKYFTIGQHLEF